MQEMVERAKLQSHAPDPPLQSVSFPMKDSTGVERKITIEAAPAHFGTYLEGKKTVTAHTVIVNPFRGCSTLKETERIRGKIAIMERGDCIFVEKTRKVSGVLSRLAMNKMLVL